MADEKKTFAELIEASSFGTPGAKALRARTPPAVVEHIMKLYEASEARGGPPPVVDDEMDDEWMSRLGHSLEHDESRLMTTEEAEAWWMRSRRAWGQLQQVRRGTRVRCIYGCRSGCPMCDFGFTDRDEAISYLEYDMEISRK